NPLAAAQLRQAGPTWADDRTMAELPRRVVHAGPLQVRWALERRRDVDPTKARRRRPMAEVDVAGREIGIVIIEPIERRTVLQPVVDFGLHYDHSRRINLPRMDPAPDIFGRHPAGDAAPRHLAPRRRAAMDGYV